MLICLFGELACVSCQSVLPVPVAVPWVPVLTVRADGVCVGQGGGSETQSYLDRLLEAVESYFYASNAGSWQDPLSRFLSHVCAVLVRRYNR